MQRLEVSGAVRPLYGSLDLKGLITMNIDMELISHTFHVPSESSVCHVRVLTEFRI